MKRAKYDRHFMRRGFTPPLRARAGFMYSIGCGVWSKLSLKELRKKYQRTDFVVLDLDGCLFPGTSQMLLSKYIIVQIAKNRRSFSDIGYLVNLSRGLFFIFVSLLKQYFGVRILNPPAMRKFEKIMRNIPEYYFINSAKKLPPLSYPKAFETLRLLSLNRPVGIISLTLNIILDEFLRHFRIDGGSLLSFYDSNVAVFRQYYNDRIFVGYDRSALIFNKEDKRKRFEKRLAEYGAKCPLVIGHNEDEVDMVRLARDMDGFGIGFNPDPGVQDAFDVIVKTSNWDGMFYLIQKLTG